MQETSNYQYPIWEDNDIPTWLVGWNNTMTKIDKDIKAVADRETESETNISGLETQITNANDEINNLTGEVSDNTRNIQSNKEAIEAVKGNVTDLQNRMLTAENGIKELNVATGKVYRGVLVSTETTLAIEIEKYNDKTLVEVFASKYGVAPLTVELRTQSDPTKYVCVTTWDKGVGGGDMQVAVLIRNEGEVI